MKIKQLPFLLLAAIVLLLIAGSAVEKCCGTSAALSGYTSEWSVLLWGITVGTGLFFILRKRKKLGKGTVTLHLAFAVILFGAFLTWTEALHGTLTLDRSERFTHAFVTEGKHVRHLPFEIRATGFSRERKAGTNAVSDYWTTLEIRETDGTTIMGDLSMNHVFTYRHYRFSQLSMGPQTTTLSVYHDPWGIAVTYTGYALLPIAFLFFLFDRKTMFRHHLRALRKMKNPLIFLLFLTLSPGTLHAENQVDRIGNATVIPEQITADRPDHPSATPSQQPSASRFRAGQIYHRTRPGTGLTIVLWVTGLSGLFFRFRSWLGQRKLPQPVRVWELSVLIAATLWIGLSLTLRGYAAGHVPMGNGYETMLLMAFLCPALALCFRRHFILFIPFGLLLCGLSLTVAEMTGSGAEITPLQPVLSSPLLSIHVALVMAAYALLALQMCGSLTALFFRKKAGQLQHLCAVLLVPALFLLTAGIFVGAIWANISWGRYWGWDPKEVWALITLLVYSFALHEKSLPVFRRPLFYHAYCVAAFLCVLMTWFGVTFFLGGLHSYV